MGHGDIDVGDSVGSDLTQLTLIFGLLPIIFGILFILIYILGFPILLSIFYSF